MLLTKTAVNVDLIGARNAGRYWCWRSSWAEVATTSITTLFFRMASASDNKLGTTRCAGHSTSRGRNKLHLLLKETVQFGHLVMWIKTWADGQTAWAVARKCRYSEKWETAVDIKSGYWWNEIPRWVLKPGSNDSKNENNVQNLEKLVLTINILFIPR